MMEENEIVKQLGSFSVTVSEDGNSVPLIGDARN